MAKELIARLRKTVDYEAIIKKGEPFTDTEFPPDNKYFSKLEDTDAVKWMRASDIYKGKGKIYDSFDSDDIIQGSLGTCYWLSAIAAVAEFPNRIESLFLTKKANAAGCYAVRLFIAGQPVVVVIDDFFPVTKAGKPAFVSSKGGELWVMILEKAWAKLHGGFDIVEGGDSRESLSALTGCHVDYIKHETKSDDDLWKIIKEADELHYAMCTGAKVKKNGVEPGHAYTLINAYERMHLGKKLQLVQIRNPWGSFEWTGAWNDKDPQWTPELNADLKHTVEDDGTFFMTFQDFKATYMHSFVAKCRETFISSHISEESNSVVAAFKVMNPMKANISSYQITGRLGKTVKATHKPDPQTIALYKLEGGKLNKISTAGNNAVGIASVETELTGGIYVIHAMFTGDAAFPYIGLVVSSERIVDLVKVACANAEEATKDKIDTALATVKIITVAPAAAVTHCKFDVCTKGHKLVWSVEVADAGDLCEGCRKPYDYKVGRWSCKDCGYDVCTNCKPKELHKKVVGDKKEEIIQCFKGHPMVFGEAAKKDSIYICGKCGHAYKGEVPAWRCEPCQGALCFKCLPPTDPTKTPKEVDEIKTCFRGHGLVFTQSAMRKPNYECSICHKLGFPQAGRWSCFVCSMNICPICIPAKQDVAAHVIAKTGITSCKSGHPLAFTCYCPEKDGKYACDKCNKNIGEDNWRWSCLGCGFDVCSDCRPEPEGRKDVLCPKMHKLTFSKNPINNSEFGRCDKCSKAFNLTGGRYGCIMCSFELCLKCLPIDKELEEKGCKHKHERGGCCCTIF